MLDIDIPAILIGFAGGMLVFFVIAGITYFIKE